MVQVGPKLAKDCIKLAKDGIRAVIPNTNKLYRRNNELSCLQWSALVHNGAV